MRGGIRKRREEGEFVIHYILLRTISRNIACFLSLETSRFGAGIGVGCMDRCAGDSSCMY